MKGTVIESMKKTMFHRIGAFALAGMLAMSLTVPAFAAPDEGDVNTTAQTETTPETSPKWGENKTLTINNTIEGVTYKLYPVLVLEKTVEQDGHLLYQYKPNENANMVGILKKAIANGYRNCRRGCSSRPGRARSRLRR